MSKTYYLAADGGGSKLQAILYDESYRVIRTGRVAGVNTLYKPAEVVRDNLEGMMKALLHGDGGEEPVTRLTAADLCMIGSGDVMRDILSRLDHVGEITFHSEPVVGLAACLKTEGAVALSGTGSDAFFVKNGTRVQAVGGWGPLLGDEGSGYEIGLNAIKAAIYAHDGRKEPSMLYDLVMERWCLTDLWDIVPHLAGNPDARHEIASAAVLCTQAAYAGDKAAISIYEHAALEMYRQARVIIEKNRNEWDGTVVITGGAWKGYHRMYDIFKQEITLTYPEARVQKPVFEPLVGCAVLGCLQNGYTLSDLEAPIKQGFADLLYSE